MKITVLADRERPGQGAEAKLAVSALGGAGHAVRVEEIGGDARAVLDRLAEERPDIVVHLVRPGGRRPLLAFELAGALDLMRIPHTGAGAQGLLVGGDAARARQVARLAGVPVAEGDDAAGRAISVFVLGNRRPEVFPACELRGRGAWRRAALSAMAAARVAAVARRIHRELDLDGYHRIDVRVRADGVPRLAGVEVRPALEAPRAGALHAPLDAATLMKRIVHLGLRRPRPPEW